MGNNWQVFLMIPLFDLLCYKGGDEDQHVGKEKKMGNKGNVHAIKSWA